MGRKTKTKTKISLSMMQIFVILEKAKRIIKTGGSPAISSAKLMQCLPALYMLRFPSLGSELGT